MQNLKLLAVASAVIATIALSGCEQKTETPAEPAAQTEAPATQTPTAPEAPAAGDAQTATPAAQEGADVKTLDPKPVEQAAPQTEAQPAEPAKTK